MADVENVNEEVKEVKKSRKNGKKETDTKSLRLSSNNIEWLDEFFQEHGNLTQDEANIKEEELIKLYRATEDKYGYNIK